MRWYARPENAPHQLRGVPRLASWEKSDHPEQVRLREYLDDTAELLGDSRIDGPWALRLDVGRPSGRDLLDMADVDNYVQPLAARLNDPGLVSVWCTKQHSEQSFVRIEAAQEVQPPSGADVVLVTTTASWAAQSAQEQIYSALGGTPELPAGPVRLELSFVVGPGRNWLNLWKKTVDSLDPILGRTRPDRAWHPLDGRITELGLHVAVDPGAGNDVIIGIAAAPASRAVERPRAVLHTEARRDGWAGDGPSNPIRAEIEQILITNPRTRYAKVLIGVRNGLTDAEMAEESIKAGEPINAESIANVRKLVRLSLNDELVRAPSDAASQAGLYRELLNYWRSPELKQHIATKLAKLRELDPKIPLTPLGPVHLGANGPARPDKPENVCSECFMLHAGECP